MIKVDPQENRFNVSKNKSGMKKAKIIVGLLSTICSLFIIAPHSQAAPFTCATVAKTTPVSKPFSSEVLPCIGTTTKISLAQIKGPALINVWGSWCFPCRQELPLLRKAYLTGKIPIIGVDVEESSAKRGMAFATSQKVTWLNLFDPDSRTKSVFGFGVPVTWFINAQGKIVYKHVGVYAKYSDIQSDIKKEFGITV